jgi:uncharacterized protein with HEPN domain
MVKWNVVDRDAASALATRLENLGEEIGNISTEMKSKAESIGNMTGCVDMNVTIGNYLLEAADLLADTTDPVQNAGSQLAAIVASSEQFAEASATGAVLS